MTLCTLCRIFARRQRQFLKCMYGSLKDNCNATASAVYTTYRLIEKQRFLPDCPISEYIAWIYHAEIAAMLSLFHVVNLYYVITNQWY